MPLGRDEYETIVLENVEESQSKQDEASSMEIVEYLNKSDYITPKMHNPGEINFATKTYGDGLAYMIDQLESEENEIERIWEYSTPEEMHVPLGDEEMVYGDLEFDVPEKSVYVIEAETQSAVVGHEAVIERLGIEFLGKDEKGQEIDIGGEIQSELSDWRDPEN